MIVGILEELLKQKDEIENKIENIQNSKRNEQRLKYKKCVGRCLKNNDSTWYIKITDLTNGFRFESNCTSLVFSYIEYNVEEEFFSSYEEQLARDIYNDNNLTEIAPEEFENVVLGKIKDIIRGDK